MRRIFAVISVCALAGSVLVADEFSIDFDQRVDFSKFRTFTFREATVDSPRPELDNPLFIKDLGAAIRAALTSKRLVETANNPDFFVDYRITGDDFSQQRRGNSDPRLGIPFSGPYSVRYTQGVLVIDLARPGDPTPIWRGRYRDDERTGAKLVVRLPEDAKKLIAKFPPKTKK
jgi:uncharacterized protein DUF4136